MTIRAIAEASQRAETAAVRRDAKSKAAQRLGQSCARNSGPPAIIEFESNRSALPSTGLRHYPGRFRDEEESGLDRGPIRVCHIPAAFAIAGSKARNGAIDAVVRRDRCNLTGLRLPSILDSGCKTAAGRRDRTNRSRRENEIKQSSAERLESWGLAGLIVPRPASLRDAPETGDWNFAGICSPMDRR